MGAAWAPSRVQGGRVHLSVCSYLRAPVLHVGVPVCTCAPVLCHAQPRCRPPASRFQLCPALPHISQETGTHRQELPLLCASERKEKNRKTFREKNKKKKHHPATSAAVNPARPSAFLVWPVSKIGRGRQLAALPPFPPPTPLWTPGPTGAAHTWLLPVGPRGGGGVTRHTWLPASPRGAERSGLRSATGRAGGCGRPAALWVPPGAPRPLAPPLVLRAAPGPGAGGHRPCRPSPGRGHASIWRLPNVAGLAASRPRSPLTRNAPRPRSCVGEGGGG